MSDPVCILGSTCGYEVRLATPTVSPKGYGRVVSALQLVRGSDGDSSVTLVTAPAAADIAMEFGTDGLIALGSEAGRIGLVVARVDLKPFSGAPSSQTEDAAELAMVEAMREGDRDAVKALLSDEGASFYIQTIALADIQTGSRTTVSRYGVVVSPPTGLPDRLARALVRLASDVGEEL